MSLPDFAVPLRVRPRFWPSPDEVGRKAKRLFAAEAVLPVGLDLARGVAALLVLLFHLRTWLLVPYGQVEAHGHSVAGFYLASTFGHEAVIIFFVLSGFLIGGAVLRMEIGRSGDVERYVAARIARIVPVLFGAVLLSVVLEAGTMHWRGVSACHDTAATVAGNLLALSNLGVAPLCNNMPLWSLSNEISYYVAFPAFVLLARGLRTLGIVVACAATLLICGASLTMTPWDQQNVVLYIPVWLIGAALWWMPERRVPVWPGILMLAIALAFSRLEIAKSVFLFRDVLTAASFALLLAGLFGRKMPSGGLIAGPARMIAVAASATASFSFSLYVIHNPVIDLYQVWAASNGLVLPAAAPQWGTLGCLFLACIGLATLFSLVFEKNHRALSAWILSLSARA